MPGLRVISFCLWGDSPRYCVGAIENAKLAKKFYPDFVCWYYVHGPSVPEETVKGLQTMDNVRVILRNCEKVLPNLGMSWRFEPHDDPDVELFMSRDTDTRIQLREVLAVREWIASGKTFHIMRDCPMHYPKILGGMFGSRKIPGISNMESLMSTYFTAHPDDEDQLFLLNCLYPLIKDDCMIHDEIKKYEGDICRKFPIKYDSNFNFVGQYVYENGTRNETDNQRLREYVISRLPHRVEQPFKIKTCFILSEPEGFNSIHYPRIRKHWKKFTGLDTRLVLSTNIIPRHLMVYRDEIVNELVFKGDKTILIYSGTQVPCENIFKDQTWTEMDYIKYPEMVIGLPVFFGKIPHTITCETPLSGMIDLPKVHTDYFPEDRIDKIFIVHYSKLVSRRENLEKCLKGQDVAGAVWVDWFDREILSNDMANQNYIRKHEILPRPLTAGEICNGMAHNYIIENTTGVTLVLEDDIVPGNDFVKKLQKCLENVPSDWDIIAAGGNYNHTAVNNEPATRTIEEIDIVPPIAEAVSTSCFLLSAKGANIIRSHALFKPFSAPIDYTLSLIIPDVKAKIYWVQPWIAFEGTKNGVFESSLYGRGF